MKLNKNMKKEFQETRVSIQPQFKLLKELTIFNKLLKMIENTGKLQMNLDNFTISDLIEEENVFFLEVKMPLIQIPYKNIKTLLNPLMMY